MEFECSNKLLKKLENIRIKIESNENTSITISDLIEEAIINHFNISLSDLNDEFDEFVEIENNTFENYVYIALNTDKPGPFQYGSYIFEYEPFYVGRGNGNRIDHIKYEYPYINHKIIIIDNNLSVKDSNILENNIIYTIGRLDLNTGPLKNITSGTSFKNINDINMSNLNIESMTNMMILNALNSNKTIKKAAHALNISERSLYRKINNLNFKKHDKVWSCH
jgi:hypothetical protein